MYAYDTQFQSIRDVTRIAWLPRMNALARKLEVGPAASHARHVCRLCGEGPTGREGHAALGYELCGPQVGQLVFRCRACGDRWIRGAGATARFSWDRYPPKHA